MDRPDVTVGTGEIVGAAIAGDEPAFAALTERHRRELHVHCYRMLASFDEAEDAVQETFLNAWRGRSGFEGGSQFRAWLYRIATNVCLDMLRRNSRRATGMRSLAEVPWIQPYPDLLLDQAAPGAAQGLHLVVSDILAARAELTGRGVAVTPVRHLEAGAWVDGPHPGRANYESFADFTDPDGNIWILQEVDRSKTEQGSD